MTVQLSRKGRKEGRSRTPARDGIWGPEAHPRALPASCHPASASPPAAPRAAPTQSRVAEPRRPLPGLRGRERRKRESWGAGVGAARGPRSHPSPPSRVPSVPRPARPPCRRSCASAAGRGWACCRRPRPPRCWSRPAGAARRAGTGAPWTAGPWGARPTWRARTLPPGRRALPGCQGRAKRRWAAAAGWLARRLACTLPLRRVSLSEPGPPRGSAGQLRAPAPRARSRARPQPQPRGSASTSARSATPPGPASAARDGPEGGGEHGREEGASPAALHRPPPGLPGDPGRRAAGGEAARRPRTSPRFGERRLGRSVPFQTHLLGGAPVKYQL